MVVSLQSTSSKVCWKCRTAKPDSSFREQGKHGETDKVCKACLSARTARYNQAHPEAHRATNRRWAENNSTRLAEAGRAYHLKNRAKRLAYLAVYRVKHKERLSLQKAAFAKKNRASTNAKVAARLRSDPAFKMRVILGKRTTQLMRSCRFEKCATTTEFIGCTPAQLKRHIESQFTFGMTWANHGKWHVDHIRPCASFDLSKAEQQCACFHFSNLQPLWAKDNLQKGARFEPPRILALNGAHGDTGPQLIIPARN